jgi:subtilisin family serine protease/chitodextrinase
MRVERSGGRGWTRGSCSNMQLATPRHAAIVLMLSFGLAAGPARPQEDDARHDRTDRSRQFVPGSLLVKFIPGVPAAMRANLAAGLGARRLRAFESIGVEHWKLGDRPGVEQALEILSAPGFARLIDYAEPDFIVTIDEFPDDLLLGELWGLHNLGQGGGALDADIDALEAWAVETGSPAVVVGVIDTGIDHTHPDLAENIWRNPGESGLDALGRDKRTNGIDDDQNGFIDDVIGWDFVNEDNDPMDDHGHGTHVAGTIGARGNNGIGVAGVSWHVRLMPLKFLDSGGSGSTSDAIRAIEYAASFVDDAGRPLVPITNNSWGGGQRSKALESAIAASGALFVAAAGNSGSSSKNFFPAGYSLANIIAVAATDRQDALASFSNYGSWVHLGAPGAGILSAAPGAAYRTASGTSMAAPHVAGAAALVAARRPLAPPVELKAAILDNVDLVPALSGKTQSGGRLNARRALGGAELPFDGVAPDPVVDLAVAEPPGFSTISLAWTASGDDGSSGTAYVYDLRYLTGSSPLDETSWASAKRLLGVPRPRPAGAAESFTVEALSAGTAYSFALKVMDEAGNLSPLSNAVTVATAGTPEGAWTVEVVDNQGELGYYAALAYDPSGMATIAYSDQTNNRVKFARWNGSSWLREVVGGTGYDAIDLAYGPSGAPSVTWSLMSGSQRLSFASRSTSWKTETIRKTNAWNWGANSLAFSPAGVPAVSHRDGYQTYHLAFSQRLGSSWSTQTIERAEAIYSSLAFDPGTGLPLVAYSDDLDGDSLIDTLKLARWTGAAWEIEVVETGSVGFGAFASLAFNPLSGRPAIAHRHRPGGAGTTPVLRFLEWNGAGWDVEEVDAGTYCSLVFGQDGTAYIGYAHLPLNVKVAKREPGGGWSIEVVESDVNVSSRIAIALDSGGNPTLSYGVYDPTRHLRFARRTQP